MLIKNCVIDLLIKQCFPNASFPGAQLLGKWSVSWKSGSTSAYEILQQGPDLIMKVISCTWGSCMKDTTGIVALSTWKNYPSKDGWFQVTSIHYSRVYLYVKKVSATGIKLIYWKGKATTGTGVRPGTFSVYFVL